MTQLFLIILLLTATPAWAASEFDRREENRHFNEEFANAPSNVPQEGLMSWLSSLSPTRNYQQERRPNVTFQKAAAHDWNRLRNAATTYEQNFYKWGIGYYATQLLHDLPDAFAVTAPTAKKRKALRGLAMLGKLAQGVGFVSSSLSHNKFFHDSENLDLALRALALADGGYTIAQGVKQGRLIKADRKFAVLLKGLPAWKRKKIQNARLKTSFIRLGISCFIMTVLPVMFAKEAHSHPQISLTLSMISSFIADMATRNQKTAHYLESQALEKNRY